MHVCHFADTAVESDYFKNIAAGLTRNGVRVSLVELRPGSPPKWLSEMPNVSYLSLNAAGKLRYPMAVRRLARYLADNSVDILHTHLYYAGLIGVIAKRRHKETIVALMRHHTSVVRMLGSRLHIAADKWMAENADRVMTVSNAARDYMTGVDRIRRDEIEVVYLGSDFEKMSPNAEDRARVRREFGFRDDDFIVGYVANLIKAKGHVQVIDAFAKIVSEVPQAKLFFVGRGMLDEVSTVARKFSKEQIVFAGFRHDVSACLNATDVFIQPSLSEAFSQVLIEAMGVGLPVVATDVGGAAEVIANGVNGILVPPNNPDEIAARILDLYRDPDTRDRIAAAGRKSVIERFTLENVIARHLELYNSWISERTVDEKFAPNAA